MSCIEIVIFFFVSFFTLHDVNGFEELTEVDENVILKTEEVIRNVTNQVFSDLEFKISDNKTNLKQYSAILSYLVTLTLRNYNNLKAIAKLPRVAKKSDNVYDIFLAAYNDLQRDDTNNNSFEDNNDLNKAEDNVIAFINNFVLNISQLRDSNNGDLASNINLKLVDDDIVLDFPFMNDSPVLVESIENTISTNDSDFWRPRQESGRRIYQGIRKKIKHFPFMAVVLLFEKFQCAGSIIANDLVITAASCLQMAWNNRFFRENPNYVAVRVGTKFFNGGGETIPVLELYFHPGYNPKTLRDNLCIMRLYRKINFRRKKKNVKKIEIDFTPSALPVNVDGITIVGWGPRGVDNKIVNPWHNQLAFAVLDFYGFRDCQDIYGKEYVTKRNFCAGFVSKGGGACNHDVGGPGIVHGKLTGVVSFGSPVCGAPDAPTVFTKLGFYTDWIEEIMEQDVPSHYARTTPLTTQNYLSEEPPHAKKTTMRPIIILPTTTENCPPIEKAIKQERSKKEQKELYKQFLKTLLNSEELMEYQDVINEENILEDIIYDIKETTSPDLTSQEDLTADTNEDYTPKKFTILDKYLMKEKNMFKDVENVDTELDIPGLTREKGYKPEDESEIVEDSKVTIIDKYLRLPTTPTESDKSNKGSNRNTEDLNILGRNFDENINKVNDVEIEESKNKNKTDKIQRHKSASNGHVSKISHDVNNDTQNIPTSGSIESESLDVSSKEVGLRIPTDVIKVTHPPTDFIITTTENHIYLTSKETVLLDSGKYDKDSLENTISNQEEFYKDIYKDLENMYNFVSKKEILEILDEAINNELKNKVI